MEPARLLADLLIWSRQCFTTPAFTTFVALCVGFLAQPGGHTITGMLVGTRLAGAWHHARAHRFLSHARRSADPLGLVLLDGMGGSAGRWPEFDG